MFIYEFEKKVGQIDFLKKNFFFQIFFCVNYFIDNRKMTSLKKKKFLAKYFKLVALAQLINLPRSFVETVTKHF